MSFESVYKHMRNDTILNMELKCQVQGIDRGLQGFLKNLIQSLPKSTEIELS